MSPPNGGWASPAHDINYQKRQSSSQHIPPGFAGFAGFAEFAEFRVIRARGNRNLSPSSFIFITLEMAGALLLRRSIAAWSRRKSLQQEEEQ